MPAMIHGYTSTLVTIARGDEDILPISFEHNCSLGFEQIILISHVEHKVPRKLRNSPFLREKKVFYIEIDVDERFSAFKENWINNAIGMVSCYDVPNVVYCCDADEFLHLGNHSLDETVKRLSEVTSRPGRIYAQLPWIDLLPTDEVKLGQLKRFDPKLFTRLDDGGWNGTKTLFSRTRNERIHMGYHWLVASDGSPILPPEVMRQIVTSLGLCVYHLPLRTLKQLRSRLTHYRTSGLPDTKYNLVCRLIDSNKIDLRTLYDWCVSSDRRFSGIKELAGHFDISEHEGGRLETIAKYLSTKRADCSSSHLC